MGAPQLLIDQNCYHMSSPKTITRGVNGTSVTGLDLASKTESNETDGEGPNSLFFLMKFEFRCTYKYLHTHFYLHVC